VEEEGLDIGVKLASSVRPSRRRTRVKVVAGYKSQPLPPVFVVEQRLTPRQYYFLLTERIRSAGPLYSTCRIPP